jgi:hypothetical protein
MTLDPLLALKAAKEIAHATDTPEFANARRKAGNAALTVVSTIENLLLPLAALNFGISKARTYFETRFGRDLQEQTAKIPPNMLVEPKLSVAAPTLQGLAISHDDNDLKAMYLGLLATAMDERECERAHPAFAGIIGQLSVDEAVLLQGLLPRKAPAPHARLLRLLRRTDGGDRLSVLMTHMLDVRDGASGDDLFVGTIEVMVDNWVRLGLVYVVHNETLPGAHRYCWAHERKEFRSLSEHFGKGQVGFEPGVIKPTALGIQFAEAVAMADPAMVSGTPVIHIGEDDGETTPHDMHFGGVAPDGMMSFLTAEHGD